MKKLSILVPTDFSEISVKAMKVAAELAKMVDGRVTPFYASEKNRYDRADDTPEAFRLRLDELASEHIPQAYRRDGYVSEHRPVEAIVDFSKEFDLVVMSSHGRTGISRIMLGSVTEKVIRQAKPPVLIVKNDATLFPAQKILVTTDFSENARNSYGIAAKFAQITGASIHLLYAVSYHSTEPATHLEAYVRTKEKQFRVDIARYFSAVADRVSYEAILTKKSAQEYLTRHISEHRYNVVFMATLGRSGLDFLKMGSTTSSVIRNVDTNVIITNPVTGVDWNEISEVSEELHQ